MNAAEIPYLCPEHLLPIFSYLRPKDLIKAGMVSREWYSVHHSNALWERHCLEATHGQGSKPYMGSWKHRFVIITNWEIRNFRLTKVITKRSRDFCIVDGSHFEMFYENKNQQYSIINLSESKLRETENTIKLEKYIKNTEIVSEHIYGNRLVILNKEGVILCFDIPTRSLIKKIETGLIVDRDFSSCLYDMEVICNEGKIILLNHDSNTIKMWDQESEMDVQPIKMPHPIGRIIHTCPQYILGRVAANYVTWSPAANSFLRFDINDHTWVKLDFSGAEIKASCISDKYMAFLEENGSVNIYKNNEIEKPFQVINISSEAILLKVELKIVDDWIYIMGDVFYIYDINTKDRIFSEKLEELCWDHTHFETDGNQLIIREPVQSILFNKCSYKTYDFRPLDPPVSFQAQLLGSIQRVRENVTKPLLNQVISFSNTTRQTMRERFKQLTNS